MDYTKHIQWSKTCLELINQQTVQKMTQDINKFYLAQTDVETVKVMSNYMTQMDELLERIKLYSYNPNLAQEEINLINLMCLQVRQSNPMFNLPTHPGF